MFSLVISYKCMLLGVLKVGHIQKVCRRWIYSTVHVFKEFVFKLNNCDEIWMDGQNNRRQGHDSLNGGIINLYIQVHIFFIFHMDTCAYDPVYIHCVSANTKECFFKFFQDKDNYMDRVLLNKIKDWSLQSCLWSNILCHWLWPFFNIQDGTNVICSK